ncbi:VOC family protein [Aliarcobacter cryaerophilus]|uniref:VOC family protein n=1 Tax=Aliarcobacter cryaerophilus TaxID=28198 RepID=UPI003DA33E41
MKVHHYGFLTKDIDKSIEMFKGLGYKVISEKINDNTRGIDILFLESENNQVIELVSPNSENSVVDSIMKSKRFEVSTSILKEYIF